MLLVIDVGNTNITLGVFEQETLTVSYRITTKVVRTSDEFGMLLLSLLQAKDIDKKSIDDVIIASVVPNIMHSLRNGIYKYFGIMPVIVGTGMKTGIRVTTANPKEVGADRIVDLVAAYEIYGGPALVIDFGTATTYDLITEDGCFTAGITSPGIKICANALWNDTARLPEIEIKKPESILAKDTVTSMQAGLVYGYIGQTEYIIRKVKEESQLPDLKVIATGGLGRIIADETDMITVYDPNLTLKGLMLLHKKQKR